MTDFPNQLRQWRERHNLNSAQAGNILGVSSRCVHKWEKGEIPKRATLIGCEILMGQLDKGEEVPA